MANTIGTAAEKFGELDALRISVYEMLQALKAPDDSRLDFTVITPSGLSIVEIDMKVMALCELLSRLPSNDADKALFPQTTVDAAVSSCGQLIAQYQSILSQINSLSNNGDVGTIDSAASLIRSANGQITIQVGQIFQKILNQSDIVLTSILPLLPLIRGRKRADFSSALMALTKVVEEAHKLRDELCALRKEAQADRKNVGEVSLRSTDLGQEIKRLQTEAEKDRKSLTEYVGEGTQSISTIRSLNDQAGQLQATVEDYQTQFEMFQTQLDQRENTLQSGTKRQTQLIAELGEIQANIITLNKQAEDMLSGATVAGLAGSFGRLRDELSSELWWARFVFYVAICLLFVSVIPLAGYVLPGLGEWLPLSTGDALTRSSASTTETVGQLLILA